MYLSVETDDNEENGKQKYPENRSIMNPIVHPLCLIESIARHNYNLTECAWVAWVSWAILVGQIPGLNS